MNRRIILVSIFTVIVTAEGLAQSSEQDLTIGQLQKQLDELRSQMGKMQNRIAELEAAGGIATSSSTDPVLLESQIAPAQALRSQPDETKSPEDPTSFHFKGITLTPGGFLEGTMLVRTRNENADIANNYSAIPLNGSSSRLDLYTYGGDEYAGRYAFISPTGTAAGYGSPLVSYTSCTNEVALNACSGPNRNIYEATVGYWYRLYKGEYGRIGRVHTSRPMERYR
jgi:hypothetical protein